MIQEGRLLTVVKKATMRQNEQSVRVSHLSGLGGGIPR